MENIMSATKKAVDIAVVGMSGRFPGSDNIVEFWENLVQGKELISRLSNNELKAFGVKESVINHPNYVNSCGFLENIDKFDNDFFKISSAEAAAMDPQQRLFLEEAYLALENAGCALEKHKGIIGVYAGSGTPHYFYDLIRTGYFEHYPQSKQLLHYLGNEKDFLALKAAYFLNLKGPVLNINLGSATGLAVIVKACEALSHNDADIMLAGASSLIMPNQFGYIYEPENILSKDGHCKPFDAKSNGTVLGSGVGVLVLKRLEDAIVDQNYIHGVIKGYAMTNDGHDKIGFTAPSVQGQALCVEKALEMANIDMSCLKYIETHGTGTALGDPIEVAALTKGIKKWIDKPQKCFLGSVKANIGHAQSAAGIAGVIKLIMSIKNKKIAPLIHFEKPNSQLNLSSTPFSINSNPIAWNDDIRIGGINALGMGGVNCHIVVENYNNADSERTLMPKYFKKNSHWLAVEEKKESVEYVISKNRDIQSIVEKLTDIWKKTLKINDFSADDNFETLGGSSLQAIDIISEIDRQLNIHISLDDFLKNNELILLANYIAKTSSKNLSKEKIEVLTKSKKSRTIFIVHPGNGELYAYKELAERLNVEFNLIGIHNNVFNDLLEEPHVSIDALAIRYINLIKTIQPTGPYILCGWSFGGVVAFEMSDKLIKRGESVEHLFLIDSWMKYGKNLHDINYFHQVYLKKDTGIWGKLLWQRMEALFSYHPNMLDAKITLLKASDVNEEYAEVNSFDNHWQKYCKTNIETFLIQGNHESIFESPGIERLAEAIIQSLTLKSYIRGKTHE